MGEEGGKGEGGVGKEEEEFEGLGRCEGEGEDGVVGLGDVGVEVSFVLGWEF